MQVRRIANFNIYSKIVYYVLSPTYMIKEIEKLVSCVYGVIMHLGNVAKILEKRVEHSATPTPTPTPTPFPTHFPHALSHDHKRTRLVFY